MKTKLILLMALMLALFSAPIGVQAAETANRTMYRALIIGIDNYKSTPLRGCVNDANRMSAMLQAANEGGAFYQAPVVLLDPSESAMEDAIAQTATWETDLDDVTFFYFSGACVLNDEGTRVGLIERNGSILEIEDLEKGLSSVLGTKILVFDLRYPQNRLKDNADINNTLSRVNELIVRAFAPKEGESDNNTHILTMATDYNTAALVNSVSDSFFGMPTYFLAQACGYDYQYERPCDLLADESGDGAVSIGEAVKYVDGKIEGFRQSSGLTEIHAATKTYPENSAYPMVARRTHTDVVSVTLDRTQADLPTDNAVKLNAVVAPFNASDKNLIWTSSDLAVASVDQQGNVKALRAGDAVITASSSNGISAFCEVKVRTVRKVESIAFLGEGAMITPGSSIQLMLQVMPENANETLFWRSMDETIATVNQDGVVLANAIGHAEITVSTESGVTARTGVEIVNETDVVKAIEFKETSLTLYENETYQVEYRLTPRDPINKTLVWTSSDETVAIVADSGMINVYKTGECTITATASSGVKAECKLTVSPTKIEMPERIEVRQNATKKVEYKVTPSGASEVTFTIADPAIATVDDGGTITGVAVGETTVTGTLINGESASSAVVVESIPVTDIKVNRTSMDMTIGQIETLEAAVKPGTASLEGIEWKSSDPEVATVENGVVTALKHGKTEITATAPSGKAATCKVEIKPIAIEAIRLSEEELKLVAGLAERSEAQLTAEVKPDNATDRALTFKSSNEKVATVDENGTVKAVGSGNATITATPKDNGKAKAECRVRVAKNQASYEKPVFQKEAALYVSAKEIRYTETELVVELYFFNKTKSSMKLPLAGTLVLTLEDGTAIELMEIEQGDKKLSANKSNTLEYKVLLAENEQLRDLLLVNAQATIVVPGEEAAPSAQPDATGEPGAEGTAPPQESDFVDELLSGD